MTFTLFDCSGIVALNDVIYYLYNHRQRDVQVRNEYESDKDGKREKNEKDKDQEKDKKLDNTKILQSILVQYTVRAYVHGVCAVSLKATQALGDLHLVDKAEQSKKSEGYFDFFFTNFTIYITFIYIHIF